MTFFNFRLSTLGRPNRLEWNTTDKLQLFPEDIARAMLARGWAVPPGASDIAWYNGLTPEAEIPEVPVPEPVIPEPDQTIPEVKIPEAAILEKPVPEVDPAKPKQPWDK